MKMETNEQVDVETREQRNNVPQNSYQLSLLTTKYKFVNAWNMLTAQRVKLFDKKQHNHGKFKQI